ncbi:putative neural-cadherin 2 [Chionoecetes opilio]|uniref:Putative neural-cadherin 2 n=1 Tax=Chionoecetes opilio TaxID=41210 RepID=A0A8J5CL90_CHIOP|nr:putative neural-cadherin 2 [Chionoecetes opilio]
MCLYVRVLPLCSGAWPLQLSHLLGVGLVEVGVGACGGEGDGAPPHHESCSRVERRAGYTVVDAGSTAVVGPRMRFGCGCARSSKTTAGLTCKVLTRHFQATPSTWLGWPPSRPARGPVSLRCSLLPTTPPLLLLRDQTHLSPRCVPAFRELRSREVLVLELRSGPAVPHAGSGGGPCHPRPHCLPTPSPLLWLDWTCACPQPTAGLTCKVLTRHFQGDTSTWAWVAAVPPCPEVHVSLEVLTASHNATLLYSGPDHLSHAASPPSGSASREVLVLELRSGRPFLMLDLGGGPVTLVLTASYSLADSIWHRLDVIWKDELVEMVVDLCSGGTMDTFPSAKVTEDPTSRPPPPVPPDAHTCRGAARLPSAARTLNHQRPLQVGGMAHPAPSHTTHRWPQPVTPHPLKGCVRNLRVNGELRDLGAGVLSSGSSPGCPAAQCPAGSLNCGLHGRCPLERGRDEIAECESDGRARLFHAHPPSPSCASLVRLTLSLSPLGYTTSSASCGGQASWFKTRKTDGDLVKLSSEGRGDSFGLQLVSGKACVLLQLHPDPPRTLCLARVQLTDGRWHSLHAARYGSATFLTADEADGDLYNASVSLEGRQLLEVDREAGVVLGGAPHQEGDSGTSASQRDFHEGCLEDVRICGRPVPLPPAMNRTAWGRVDKARGVGRGCDAPPACGNVTCRSPLTCVDTWRSYHCGCGEGRVMEDNDSKVCHPLDQCDWSPCLHGGTCLPSHPVLVCAVLLHQHHRRSALRRGTGDGKECTTPTEPKEHVSPSHSDGHPPYLLELRVLSPPRSTRQSSWSTNPSITDVDVLQVDAASVTSSVEERNHQQENSAQDPALSTPAAAEEGQGAKAKQGAERGGCDDLRNYAYEGGGSSSGSLSSWKTQLSVPDVLQRSAGRVGDEKVSGATRPPAAASQLLPQCQVPSFNTKTNAD